MSRKRKYPMNQHATIQSRPNTEAMVGGLTFTQGREDDFDAAIATESNNSSRLQLRVGQGTLDLTGRQARTLQRLLNKHYTDCGVASILGAEQFAY